VIVAALVLAASAAPSGPPTWAQVAAGLRPHLDPRSADPCERGDASCGAIVIAEMQRRFDRLSAICDHDAPFADLALRVTKSFWAALKAGRFRHPAAMAHFDAWFALTYFRAYDRWHSGLPAEVSGSWQVAFSNAASRSVRGIGDLLLGMNAHITRDLAHVVADVVTGPGATVDPDFQLLTQLIQSQADSDLAAIAARFDPSIALARIPVTLGPKTFGALVGAWRDQAWRDGIALRDARGSQRTAVDRRIESKAVLRADAIVVSTAYVPFVQSSRSRDAYCALHAKH